MNIYDIINRARSLREEYRLDSVTPERLGALHEDTLTYINQYQLLASSPAIHKTFVSVSAMQGSASPTSDLTGRPLKAGQLVVIVPSDQTDSTAGDVYRYDGPSGSTSKWTFVAKLGAVPADSELSATSTNPPQNRAVTEKLTELESKIYEITVSIGNGGVNMITRGSYFLDGILQPGDVVSYSIENSDAKIRLVNASDSPIGYDYEGEGEITLPDNFARMLLVYADSNVRIQLKALSIRTLSEKITLIANNSNASLEQVNDKVLALDEDVVSLGASKTFSLTRGSYFLDGILQPGDVVSYSIENSDAKIRLVNASDSPIGYDYEGEGEITLPDNFARMLLVYADSEVTICIDDLSPRVLLEKIKSVENSEAELEENVSDNIRHINKQLISVGASATLSIKRGEYFLSELQAGDVVSYSIENSDAKIRLVNSNDSPIGYDYEGKGTITIPDNFARMLLVYADSEVTICIHNLSPRALLAKIKSVESDISNLKNPTDMTISLVAPSPQLPADDSEESDFNAETVTANDIYIAMENIIDTISVPEKTFNPRAKNINIYEVIGKDASNTYDIKAYVLSRRNRFAWKSKNKLYAWKSVDDNSLIYTQKSSPLVGDDCYNNKNISIGNVTKFSVQSEAVVMDGVYYIRQSLEDIAASVLFTKSLPNDSLVGKQVDLRSELDNYVGTGIYNSKTEIVYNEDSFHRASSLDYHTENKGTILLWGNEHGPQSDPAEPCIILYRMLKDMLVGCRNHPFLQFLKKYFKIIFVPVLNPYGLVNKTRNNANNVNINRNYSTKGWSVISDTDKGVYAGDQPETQFIMSLFDHFKIDVAIDIHCLGYVNELNEGRCHYEGFIPNAERNDYIGNVMLDEYNLYYSSYGDASPNTSATGADYINARGVMGGLIEMNAGAYADSYNGNQHNAYILEADYSLLLNTIRMWYAGIDESFELNQIQVA